MPIPKPGGYGVFSLEAECAGAFAAGAEAMRKAVIDRLELGRYMPGMFETIMNIKVEDLK